MAPLGPAQERQAVSKSGCTFEQLVEAAEAFPALLHRLLVGRHEYAAAAENVPKMLKLTGGQQELPDGSSSPWPVAGQAVEREVRAQQELSTAREVFATCSETLETGVAQYGLVADSRPLAELRVTTHPTQEQVDKALISAEQLRTEACGRLLRESEPEGVQASSEDHKQTPPNKYSEDFHSVIWNGEFYEFTHGQAAAVKILWRNWENETPVVSEQTILDESGSTAERLIHVFKNGKNEAWGPMIAAGVRKGTFRLVGAD